MAIHHIPFILIPVNSLMCIPQFQLFSFQEYIFYTFILQLSRHIFYTDFFSGINNTYFTVLELSAACTCQLKLFTRVLHHNFQRALNLQSHAHRYRPLIRVCIHRKQYNSNSRANCLFIKLKSRTQIFYKFL